MFRRGDVVHLIVWVVLLFGLLAVIAVSSGTDDALREERLVRWTIWLSLAYWVTAVTLMMFLEADGWRANSGKGRLVRWCYTYAWLGYVVHVLAAMHYYHRWSHEHVLEHTREVAGVAEGAYVSYLFNVLWTADVAWWWLAPASYALRPLWLGLIWHLFMAFLIFNGTVIYETGFSRLLGILLFSWLGAVIAMRWYSKRRSLSPG